MRFVAAVDTVVMVGNIHMASKQDPIAENYAVSASDVDVIEKQTSFPIVIAGWNDWLP